MICAIDKNYVSRMNNRNVIRSLLVLLLLIWIYTLNVFAQNERNSHSIKKGVEAVISGASSFPNPDIPSTAEYIDSGTKDPMQTVREYGYTGLGIVLLLLLLVSADTREKT